MIKKIQHTAHQVFSDTALFRRPLKSLPTVDRQIKEEIMIRHLTATTAIVLMAGIVLHWSGPVLAAASGEIGVSAAVMERCRVDFSEGSADYFQDCSSVEVKASGSASNVLGELTAVDAAEDPYYLDRDPESHSAATAGATTQVASTSERRSKAPRVVTIRY